MAGEFLACDLQEIDLRVRPWLPMRYRFAVWGWFGLVGLCVVAMAVLVFQVRGLKAEVSAYAKKGVEFKAQQLAVVKETEVLARHLDEVYKLDIWTCYNSSVPGLLADLFSALQPGVKISLVNLQRIPNQRQVTLEVGFIGETEQVEGQIRALMSFFLGKGYAELSMEQRAMPGGLRLVVGLNLPVLPAVLGREAPPQRKVGRVEPGREKS